MIEDEEDDNSYKIINSPIAPQLPWECIKNLIFDKDTNNANIFTAILNECTKDFIATTIQTTVYSDTLLKRFISITQNHMQQIETNNCCKFLLTINLLTHHINNSKANKKCIQLHIGKYVDTVVDAFQNMALNLWAEESNFGKEISKPLSQLWIPKMKMIYHTFFEKYTTTNDIVTYIFHLLVRGVPENIEKECIEMCQYTSFDPQYENTVFFKSIVFRKICEKIYDS